MTKFVRFIVNASTRYTAMRLANMHDALCCVLCPRLEIFIFAKVFILSKSIYTINRLDILSLKTRHYCDQLEIYEF